MPDEVHPRVTQLGADDFTNLFEDIQIRQAVEKLVQVHNTPLSPDMSTVCIDVTAHKLRAAIARKLGFDEDVVGTG